MRIGGTLTAVASILAILAVLACGESATMVAETQRHGTYYTDEDYKILPPHGWSVGVITGIVYFANPETDFENNLPFQANINIIKEDVRGTSFNSYIDVTKQQLSTFFTSYRLEDETESSVNGQRAYFLESTFTQGEYRLRNRQLIVADNGSAFIITATALASDWGKYSELFESSLRSFELRTTD